MVVKIKPPAPSCSSAVQYNERKVAEGKAEAVFSSKIADPKKPMETFSEYERGSRRCEKMSFHASINPAKADNMTQDKVIAFTKELMERLGYGDQPYIIYRHDDIGRVHYHLVSVRVDKEGRKIPDRQEGRRCNEIMKALEQKYGFTVGLADNPEKETKAEGAKPEEPNDLGEAKEKDDGPKKVDYQRFDPARGEYMKQMEELVAQAMKYYFTTTEQFKMLMREFGVEVGHAKVGRQIYLTFTGIDPKTQHKCTAPIIGKDLDTASLEEVRQHAMDCKKVLRTKEGKRAANLTRVALEHGTSELHTRRILRKFNIGLKLSKNKGGKIFGVTLIDHQTRCVFKVSELPGISAAEFEKARLEKWPPEEGKKEENAEKEKNAAEETADLFVAALGAEKSRRHEDEEIMRKGRRGPN
jgi:hypothetical protein